MLIATSDVAHSSSTWANIAVTWDGLVDFLKKKTVITAETLAEYQALHDDEQGKIKNTGAFMAASLAPGANGRKISNIREAELCVLDADTAQPDLLDKLAKSGYSYILYSSHSSTVEAPRYRVILELSKPITGENYRHLNCRMMETFGVENFCRCSLRINQEMFYPSSPADVVPVYVACHGRPVDVDYQLGLPVAWELFKTKDGEVLTEIEGKKLGDPRENGGLVGAFCRKYTVTDCLTTFLDKVYEPTTDPTRWRLISGTTAGLVIYGDLYAYSFHSTHDAAADGHCHSAFNLLKVHLFGGDFIACCQWIADKLPEVAAEAAKDAFDEQVAADIQARGPWVSGFERNNEGEVLPSPLNCLLAVTHDERLVGISFNLLKDCRIVVSDLPWRKVGDGQWRDSDDCLLDLYLTKEFCQFPLRAIKNALEEACVLRAFNPLLDTLNSLPAWDGVKRVDSLFIDHLGATDCHLTRTMTRKWIAGCIQRAYKPGIKFDCMLMLIGPQGIQKSLTLARLSLGYFCDGIGVRDFEDGKKAQEKMAGVWIAELGEMKGMYQADKEAIKSFLSSQWDRYRPAYGRNVVERPRLTCFAGTSNREEQLTDETGNRRFWIIECAGLLKTLNEAKLVWAEAKETLMTETLWLNSDDEKLAENARKQHLEEDPWTSKIGEFLVGKEYVCVAQIWEECFQKNIREIQRKDSYRISSILRTFACDQPVHTSRDGKNAKWFKFKLSDQSDQKVTK